MKKSVRNGGRIMRRKAMDVYISEYDPAPAIELIPADISVRWAP